MNWKKVITIYRKELLDLFRDRRTVLTSIIVPIVLYPLIMIGFSSIMIRQESKLDEQSVDIYFEDKARTESSFRIYEALQENDRIKLLIGEDFQDEMIGESLVHAGVIIRDSLTASGYEVILIQVSYNKAKEKSELAYSRLRKIFRDLEKDLVRERLASIRIDEDILSVVDVKENNVAPPEEMLGFFVGKILPYLLIIVTLSGGAVVASDLVAGEKERGTLETILVSAASRLELVLGKYMTIITISFISVLLNLFSMYFSFRHIMFQSGVETTGMQLPISNFALILVAMIPLVTFLSAILLSLSTYARNIKEAQSYQMPILFTGMILAMISMMPGFELTTGFALIPIVNFSLLFKNIMMNNFQMTPFLLVIGSTLVLDLIAIKIAIDLFNKEGVLFRTAEEKSLKFWGKEKGNIFSPQFIMIFFLVVLMALFYLGGSWQSQDIVQGLFKTQIFIILLPTLLILRISRTDIVSTLRLKRTSPLNILMVLIMAFPALLVAVSISNIINLIYPISESYLEVMKNLMSTENRSFLFTLGLVAVLPGICEEVMFRGYLINGFTRRGLWSAIIVSGILFGIFHLDPFRFLPTAVLGVYLGYLTLRSNSLLPAVFAHFLNNGLAIVITNYGNDLPLFSKIFPNEEIPIWYGVPALLILIILLKIFDRINQRVPELPNLV
ncbi:MAG: CPBP family intramembrane metalloprotease [Candidatus Cloacimonetes bacterium]|nr:CPBP family intramembrane metalloprotease [Candidatus Cloacimonadota bacterium]